MTREIVTDDPELPIEGTTRVSLSVERMWDARWATEGSGGLLEIGPTMVHRLWAPVAEAESTDDDSERLAGYHQLREMLSWLRFPLVHLNAYPEQT